MKRSVSPTEQSSGYVLAKQLRVNKDVNGIAITGDSRILLAIGSGSLGGIGTVDIESGNITVNQQGK